MHRRRRDVIGLAFQPARNCLRGIESLLSAVIADGMAGARHDPNAELQGLSAVMLGLRLLATTAPAFWATAPYGIGVRVHGQPPFGPMPPPAPRLNDWELSVHRCLAPQPDLFECSQSRPIHLSRGRSGRAVAPH